MTNQEQLFTADKMLKGFLPKEDSMMVFSKEIYPLFKDEDFKDFYSDKGRNGISPAFFPRVTLLQYKENLSDTEAKEACTRRIDWKIALHIPLEEKVNFDSSTLCYFRRRLKENNALSIVFDKIVELAIKKKFIKKKTNQRIDATHIVAHVNRISTTDLLFRTVKCVVEEIEKLNKEFYYKQIPEDIKERYSCRFSSFGLSKAKRVDKQAEIVEDGLHLKKLIANVSESEIEKYKQLKIMEIIFEENVIIKKKEIGNKEFIEIEEIQRPKQTIFNPRDVELKMGMKGKKSWVGSKCHILETAEKGEINFITDMLHQKANENDKKIMNQINTSSIKNLFCDGGYLSGRRIKEYEDNGKKLMGYFQAANKVKPEGFRISDFDIDMKNKKAKCPGKQESSCFTELKDETIGIRFRKSVCMQCEDYDLCVGKNKAKTRILNITKTHGYIQKRRIEQKTKEFKNQMKVRAQVEGTISEAVRFHGLRYKKYKGVLGDKLQFYLTGAAINFKRLTKAINKALSVC